MPYSALLFGFVLLKSNDMHFLIGLFQSGSALGHPRAWLDWGQKYVPNLGAPMAPQEDLLTEAWGVSHDEFCRAINFVDQRSATIDFAGLHTHQPSGKTPGMPDGQARPARGGYMPGSAVAFSVRDCFF